MYLSGFTTAQDAASYLSASISASATTININDATSASRGIIEVDDELLWADTVNQSTGDIVLPPYGRGFRGTVAATHPAGSRVAFSPMFPRAMVKQAINESIRATFPDLFGVASTTFTFSPAVTTYALPAGAMDVLSVSWQEVGPTQEWCPVRRYRVDGYADSTAFPTGSTISLYDAITPGRTVRVVYTKQPTVLSNNSDEFTTVTGLPASTEDVIRFGAAYRMVPFMDLPHLSGFSAEADFAANQRQVGSSSQVGRYMLQMYQVRLQEESRRLRDVYPIRTHYTR